MYPRNNASPEPIAIGAVVQISDGAVQTSGVTVRIKPVGVSEGNGAGTTAYSTDGVVMYTPTQAETNYTSFILIATKSGCIPVSVTVVTSQSATAGQVRLEGVTHTSAVIPTVTTTTNLTNLPTIPNNWLTAAGIATGAFTSAKFASGAFDAVWTVSSRTLTSFGTLVSDIWSHATRLLTAGTNIVLAKGTGVTGFNDLDAAGVRSAVGLASANLDTQLGDIPTAGEIVSAIAGWQPSGGGGDDFEQIIVSIHSDAEVINNVKIVTDKLDTSMELDGAVYRFTTNALEQAPSGGGSLTAADVWDYLIAGSPAAGSAGAALAAAGSAGDPWSTLLPGSYTAGQAGWIIDVIYDKALLITGTDMFIAVDRVTNGTITMYKNESTSVTVPLSEDTTSKTLRFTVEDAYGTDILTIANGSIIRNASSFTVTIPSTVTDELANHTWALRDITSGINRLVRKGVLTVQAAADNDA